MPGTQGDYIWFSDPPHTTPPPNKLLGNSLGLLDKLNQGHNSASLFPEHDSPVSYTIYERNSSPPSHTLSSKEEVHV